MIEALITAPAVNVADAEYRRLLGYPRDHEPADRARELAAAVRAWYAQHGRPWVYLREVSLGLREGRLWLDGMEFQSRRLHDHLAAASATRAVLVAASAGRACEDRARQNWELAQPDEYFFTEIYGSAIVEHLVATTSGRICDLAARDGLMAIPHYSPGYAGWDVAEQGRLFDLITSRMAQPFPEPLEVFESGMLRPKKSLLGVFGLAPRTEAALRAAVRTPCETCAFSPCAYRRAPYRFGAVATAAPAAEDRTSPVAAYTVNRRALEKWARERVQLHARPDGSCEAHFRFDGTTCANLGHPLAFDYTVRLAPGSDAHRILQAECAPAAGDEGHRRMCAYLTDDVALMRAISAPPPLVGRPLADVLTWAREARATGCYCDGASRAHKWGLALEAIHFALHHPASSLTPLASRR